MVMYHISKVVPCLYNHCYMFKSSSPCMTWYKMCANTPPQENFKIFLIFFFKKIIQSLNVNKFRFMCQETLIYIFFEQIKR